MPIPTIQNVPTNMNVVLGITNYKITYSLLVHNVRKITNLTYLELIFVCDAIIRSGWKEVAGRLC